MAITDIRDRIEKKLPGTGDAGVAQAKTAFRDHVMKDGLEAGKTFLSQFGVKPSEAEEARAVYEASREKNPFAAAAFARTRPNEVYAEGAAVDGNGLESAEKRGVTMTSETEEASAFLASRGLVVPMGAK